MLTCECLIIGSSPIGFSAPIQSHKKTGERADEFEERTWRERMHVQNGEVFIPPMALKNCLSDVAKYLQESVPGKGKSTFTKHFEAGVMVIDPLMLGVQADTVTGLRLFVPADGRRGSGKRVWKIFPVINEWKTQATIYVADPVINADKVLEYLEYAGRFIGMGFFRPRNNGYFGRFTIKDFKSRNEK